MTVPSDYIFISSTIFDLIDARSEVETFFRDNGVKVIMSDSKSEGFEIYHDEHSISSCLKNIKKASHFIVILSRRYGATLESFDHPDISATHLEIQTAKDHNIPISFYCRDRLMTDYGTWKKNGKKSDVKFLWVEKGNEKLFEVIDEHNKKRESSNWIQEFRDTQELKSLLAKDFGPTISKVHLQKSISNNELPVFTGKMETVQADPNHHLWGKVSVKFQNATTNPAFNVKLSDSSKGESEAKPVVVKDGESFLRTFVLNDTGKDWNYETEYKLEYYDSCGNLITDLFNFDFRGDPITGVIGSIKMTDRRYKLSNDDFLEDKIDL